MRTRGKDKQTELPRRRSVSNSIYRVGRTLNGDTQKVRAEKIARAADRKKRKMKNIAVGFGVCLIVVLLGMIIYGVSKSVAEQREMERIANLRAAEPTVSIRDENVGKNVSMRTKEFVARLENDVKEYGYEVDYVVLPYHMVRQIDVYIKGRKEYYKLTLDRSSAVQAEDLSRMVNYLSEKKLQPGYVDLRVEGKAYYK